jgi:enoyl-CoA hydratase
MWRLLMEAGMPQAEENHRPVVTERVGRAWIVTMNRPHARNALNADLAQGILDALQELDSRSDLSVGVLAGRGPAFCAGLDLKSFARSGRAPDALVPLLSGGASKPLIAAVEGAAVAGGLELVLMCDLVVAGRSARFGIPEVGRGLVAAGGALFRLPRRLPQGLAMKLALTGESVTADEAHRHCLVTELVDDGAALACAVALAERVAANAPLAVAATKRIVLESAGRCEVDAWELQKPDVRAVLRSQDAREGARAFADGRPPVWVGR